MKRPTNSQIVNTLAMASAIAGTVAAAATQNGIHLPAWAYAVLAVVAGLSRSVLPALSGQAGVDPRAGQTPPAGTGVGK